MKLLEIYNDIIKGNNLIGEQEKGNISQYTGKYIQLGKKEVKELVKMFIKDNKLKATARTGYHNDIEINFKNDIDNKTLEKSKQFLMAFTYNYSSVYEDIFAYGLKVGVKTPSNTYYF